MQNRRMELLGQLCVSEKTSVLRRATTYLAKLALVLQDAPDKSLTFARIMDRMVPLVFEDRKSAENNLRVCLSSHKCFVKIPVYPYALESRKYYWKLDCSHITAKMVRRHFKGLLQFFPELACKVEAEKLSGASSLRGMMREGGLRPPASSPACGAVQVRCEVKFSGPFSIESLLKREQPSPRTPRASPLQQLQPAQRRPETGFGWSCEEPLLVSSPVWPAGGGTRRGAAPAARHPTSMDCRYITYFIPVLNHDVLRF